MITTEPKRTGASLARGQSKQDYATPPEFLKAVIKRFGPLEWDLAASAENSVAGKGRHYTKNDNALREDCGWRFLSAGALWLNPPYNDIDPWAKKAAQESLFFTRVLLLTPASVGTNWFADHVSGKAMVLFLRPRLQFVGATDPYPKDLMLSCFGYLPGFECWKWK